MKLVSNPSNPAYDCVFSPLNVRKFEETPSIIPPLGIRLLPHLESADLDIGVICDCPKIPESPPWFFKTPAVRFDLARYKKDNTSSLAYKAYYSELCRDFPAVSKIFTDGSKSDEGVACAAFCPSSPGGPLSKNLPSESSIYTAELTALLLALDLISQSWTRDFLILSDSLSALQAIAGRNLDHPLLMKFHKLYTELSDNGYNICLAWLPGHVGVRGNEAADRLAKEATKLKQSFSPIPFSDLKPKVNSYIQDLWQEDWEFQQNNKLFQSRPKLRGDYLPSASGGRKEETVLTRLHTGHSFLTHSFLLKGEDAPWCFACDKPLTIKHLLIDSWDLHDTRHKHFTAESIKTLFRDVPPDALFAFLKEIHVFNKI